MGTRTRGGTKARGNSLHKTGAFGIDFNGFAEYAEKIDRLGGDLQAVFTKAMEQAFETITEDTVTALENQYLPAQGKYSKGDTLDSLITDAKVTWSGSVAEMPVGFDKTKPGAGGWLITGTPRMQPDQRLAVIYDSKSYLKNVQRDIEKLFVEEVKRLMG